MSILNPLPEWMLKELSKWGVREQDVQWWTAIPIIRSTRGRGQLTQSTVTVYLKDARSFEWVQKWR